MRTRNARAGPPAFGRLLREARFRAGRSQNVLARGAGIDPAYVSRLDRGRDRGPGREVVLAIGEALGLGPAWTDRLVVPAGHWPPWLVRLGGWDPLLGRLAEQRADPTRGPSLRATLEYLVEHTGRARPLAHAPRREGRVRPMSDARDGAPPGGFGPRRHVASRDRSAG